MNKLDMESKIINIVEGCLVVEPFRLNNAILDFPKGMDIELMVVPPDDVPYVWKRVEVAMKVYHDTNVHVIKTRLPGIRMNRRSNFRVFIGTPSKITNITEKPINTTLKDVSNNGFAILTDKKTDIPLHTKITVEYLDQEMQKYFELSGRPVRKLEQEQNILYGCILDKRYPELENYINQKQLSMRPNSQRGKKNEAPAENTE